MAQVSHTHLTDLTQANIRCPGSRFRDLGLARYLSSPIPSRRSANPFISKQKKKPPTLHSISLPTRTIQIEHSYSVCTRLKPEIGPSNNCFLALGCTFEARRPRFAAQVTRKLFPERILGLSYSPRGICVCWHLLTQRKQRISLQSPGGGGRGCFEYRAGRRADPSLGCLGAA